MLISEQIYANFAELHLIARYSCIRNRFRANNST